MNKRGHVRGDAVWGRILQGLLSPCKKFVFYIVKNRKVLEGLDREWNEPIFCF